MTLQVVFTISSHIGSLYRSPNNELYVVNRFNLGHNENALKIFKKHIGVDGCMYRLFTLITDRVLVKYNIDFIYHISV